MNAAKVIDLVKMLRAQRFHDGIFNPWNQLCQYDVTGKNIQPIEARCERMRMHLSGDIKLILCGLNGVNQGVRYTGVPLTSESLLLQGAYPRLGKPTQRLSKRKHELKEAVATSINRVTARHGVLENCLFWDVLMGCPYTDGDEFVNRRPTDEELSLGTHFLGLVRNLHPDAIWIALGKRVEDVLQRERIPFEKVKHPGKGGTVMFDLGLARVIRKYRGQHL